MDRTVKKRVGGKVVLEVEVEVSDNPLFIHSHVDERGTQFSVSFGPDALPALARAIERAGHPLSGYTIQQVLMRLAEKDAPAWAAELDFDAESGLFAVNCARRRPLELLVARLRKRLASRAAMRRLVEAAGLREGAPRTSGAGI